MTAEIATSAHELSPEEAYELLKGVAYFAAGNDTIPLAIFRILGALYPGLRFPENSRKSTIPLVRAGLERRIAAGHHPGISDEDRQNAGKQVTEDLGQILEENRQDTFGLIASLTTLSQELGGIHDQNFRDYVVGASLGDPQRKTMGSPYLQAVFDAAHQQVWIA